MPGVWAAVVSLAVLVVTTVGAMVATTRRRHPVAEPEGRPFEEIAADVRRISVRYHQAGMRFAQYEGRRQSYDRVLAEAADTLEIPHLVGVLAPGSELDRERDRLENLLSEVGVLRPTP